MRDMTDEPAFAPFVPVGTFKTPSILCGYGCGRRFVVNPTSKLRGHPGCLVELGQDLWALARRFPRLALKRLAADLGLSLHTLEGILKTARHIEPMKAELAVAPAPWAAPKPLTVRDRGTLAVVINLARAAGQMPGDSDLAEAMAITRNAAAIRLFQLRRKGWVSFTRVHHVVRCADLGCERGWCPAMFQATPRLVPVRSDRHTYWIDRHFAKHGSKRRCGTCREWGHNARRCAQVQAAKRTARAAALVAA